ncbi:MAG: acyltransferase [Acidimicrobiales bacterium]|jgi:acetyltransferase-like isoleucine patch superfamily enzyme
MNSEPGGVDSLAAGPSSGVGPSDFGVVFRARGYLRRRIGLAVTRLRHPRVTFGARCDVRSGGRFTVARGADVSFGSGCVLDHGFTLESSGHLEVGDRTVFGHHCTVAADRSIVIGGHCLFGEMVSIRDHDHAFDGSGTAILDQGRATAPVHIGDDVWVGAKATITRGVTIGSGAVVGAHAVVTHDLPAGSVAVGVPARVVRMRDSGGAPG